MRITLKMGMLIGMVSFCGASYGKAGSAVPELREKSSFPLRKPAKMGRVWAMKPAKPSGGYTYALETGRSIEFRRLNGAVIRSVKLRKQYGEHTAHWLYPSQDSRYVALTSYDGTRKESGGREDWIGIFDGEGNLAWSITGPGWTFGVPAPCGDYVVKPSFPGVRPPAFYGPSGLLNRETLKTDYLKSIGWRGGEAIDPIVFSD